MTDWKNRIVEYGVKAADQFTAHPSNPRRHPQAQRDAVKSSLDTLGWIGVVVENKRTGYLIDGHERVMQALVDNADVPYIVVDLSEDEEAQALLTFDWITQMAVYDNQQLDELMRSVNSDDAGIQQLISDMGVAQGIVPEDAPIQEDAGAQVDRADELLQTWQVERGQLWIIPSKSGRGEHRLLCGDSTDADDVARVMGEQKADCMWSDPPYGVSYVGKTPDAMTIQNDSADDLPQLLDGAFRRGNAVLCDGAPIYIAHPAGALSIVFAQSFLSIGWHFHETLVWVKDSMVLSHCDYHYKHEPIIYGWKGTNRKWYAGRDQVTVFEVDRPKRNAEHPTMKPVNLVCAHLQNSTKRADIVYDPFGGSGTTMVACEQLGRQCRMIEIEPKYCAVILQRMKDMGLEPRLSE